MCIAYNLVSRTSAWTTFRAVPLSIGLADAPVAAYQLESCSAFIQCYAIIRGCSINQSDGPIRMKCWGATVNNCNREGGGGGGKKGGGAVGLTSHKCTGVEEVDHSLWQVGVVPLHWPLALQVRLDGPLIGYPTSHEYVALSPKRVPSLVSTRPLLGATRGPQETPAKNIDTAHNTLCRIRSMYECIWDVLCW